MSDVLDETAEKVDDATEKVIHIAKRTAAKVDLDAFLSMAQEIADGTTQNLAIQALAALLKSGLKKAAIKAIKRTYGVY